MTDTMKISECMANQLGRLAELKKLGSGWLDGEGETISVAALQSAQDILFTLFREFPNTARPYIYPMPEGGINIEWDAPVEVCVLSSGAMRVVDFAADDEEAPLPAGESRQVISALARLGIALP